MSSYLDDLSQRGKDQLAEECLDLGRRVAALVKAAGRLHSDNFIPLSADEKAGAATEILSACIGILYRHDPAAAEFVEQAALRYEPAELVAPPAVKIPIVDISNEAKFPNIARAMADLEARSATIHQLPVSRGMK